MQLLKTMDDKLKGICEDIKSQGDAWRAPRAAVARAACGVGEVCSGGECKRSA